MVAGPIVSCFRRACFYRRTLGARRVASGRGTLPIANGYHWADISPSTPWAGQIWEPRSIWLGSSLHLASSTPAQPPAGGNVGLYPLWRSPRSHPRPTSFPPFCPGFCTHDGSAYWPVVLPPCLLRRKITLCPDVPLHSARRARCRRCAGLAPPPPTRRCERRDIHTYTYTSAEMAGPQPCWRPVHVQENFRALLMCVCVCACDNAYIQQQIHDSSSRQGVNAQRGGTRRAKSSPSAAAKLGPSSTYAPLHSTFPRRGGGTQAAVSRPRHQRRGKTRASHDHRWVARGSDPIGGGARKQMRRPVTAPKDNVRWIWQAHFMRRASVAIVMCMSCRRCILAYVQRATDGSGI